MSQTLTQRAGQFAQDHGLARELRAHSVQPGLARRAGERGAGALPAVQRKKVFQILFGLDVNHEFKYDRFFAMIPSGPDTKPAFTAGFFETAVAQSPKPETVALAFADA